MEERGMSWSEAFRTAINNLTGVSNEGNSRTMRWFFIILFLGGVAWAVYFYMEAQDLLAYKDFFPSESSTADQVDKKRLEGVVNQVKTASEMRKGSLMMSENMLAVSKYPFADPTTVEPPEPPDEGTTIVDTGPTIVIDYPPEGLITLKAIMVMGKSQVAVMDIYDPNLGVSSQGVIVKAGDTFSNKKGRVLRITSEKIVIRWGDKDFDIIPGASY